VRGHIRNIISLWVGSTQGLLSALGVAFTVMLLGESAPASRGGGKDASRDSGGC